MGNEYINICRNLNWTTGKSRKNLSVLAVSTSQLVGLGYKLI